MVRCANAISLALPMNRSQTAKHAKYANDGFLVPFRVFRVFRGFFRGRFIDPMREFIFRGAFP